MNDPMRPLIPQAPLPVGTPLPVRAPLAGRAPVSAAAHAPKARPDARPMRIALGAAGLAAFSALVGAIVLPPRPAVYPATYVQQQAAPAGGAGQGPIQYIQLQPGQTAPPGAVVIDPTAQPVSGAAAVPAPALKPIIIRTTQSGKVIP